MKSHNLEVTGYFVNSARARRFPTHAAIAELIDNAIDAHAKSIHIEFDRDGDKVVVYDDGRGCADLARFGTLGALQDVHDEETGRVGRYGVGVKEACMALCSEQRVVSVHRGIRREAHFPWDAWSKQRAAPRWTELEPRAVKEPSGTTIEMLGMQREGMFTETRIAGCERYWRRIYAPALDAGVSVLVDGRELSPTPAPPLTSERQFSGVFDGKPYRARVGIVDATGDDWEPGWYVACSSRLLNDKALLDGLENWPGADIWGYFELIEGTTTARWRLDTNKRGFAERAAFFEHVVEQIRDLLDEAMRRSQDVETGLLERELSEDLAAAVGGTTHWSREQRGKGDEHGTVIPINSGKRRERAEKVDPELDGSVRENKNKTRTWQFKFKAMGQTAEICRAGMSGRSCWITFNTDNTFVASNRANRDTLMALASHAIWVSADNKERAALWAMAMPDMDFEMHDDIARQSERWVGAVLRRYAAHKTAKEQRQKAKARTA